MAYAATAKVNTGSTRTYQEMADWAQKKMALYKNALIGMEPVKQNYLMFT